MQLTPRETIQYMLRCPGGLHEWLMVARADKAKAWGLKLEQLNSMRTPLAQVEFVEPPGRHGGPGSARAHHELLELLESSISFEDFKIRLYHWAGRRVRGGRDALPRALIPASKAAPAPAASGPATGQVAIWLVQQPSAAGFAAYLEETYHQEMPAPPLSPFARDTGIAWYDHDFLEADYQASNPTLSELLRPFSYADTFAADVLDCARQQGVIHAQGIVLLYNFMAPLAKTVSGALNFLGRFSYTRK